MGLMQLMPATATELGVGNPFDPAENIRGGIALPEHLLDRYDGKASWRWPPTTPAPARSIDTAGTCRPYHETRDYVRKITEQQRAVQARPRASTNGSRSSTAARSRATPTRPAVPRLPSGEPPDTR